MTARTVIVSVGGTGIGRATARRFALAGDEVTIMGRRENVLAAVAAEINVETDSPPVHAVAGDLSDAHSVAAVAETAAGGGGVRH